MTPSSLAACRIGCAALLAVAMCRCGLSAAGYGALSDTDGGESSGGSSGYASSGGGSSSGTTTGPGSSSGGGNDVDGPDPNADDAPLPLPPPGMDGAADARRADAASKDASTDGSATCSTLMTCCSLLSLYGSSASSVQSCLQAAATNDPGTCSTVLGPFEGLGLCP